MNIDPLAKNDIISRWKNHQSVRGIAKDTQLGREVIARVIRQQIAQTQSPEAISTPAGFGPAKLTRKSKLDPFLDSLKPKETKGAIHLKKAGIDCKILFLNTSSTIGTELYDEFRNKKSPCPAASDQNQTTKLPLSISFNQTTVAEKQLEEDLRHAGRGEPPVR